jgi:hypothetical protein
MSEPTQEQPEVTPTVTTAPAGSSWSRIPDHLGRARTSTVVLGVLFVALFTLYLYIRPDTPGATAATTGDQTSVSTPAPAPETSAAPTTEEPTTTAAPTDTTTQAPATTRSTVTPTPTGTTAVPTPTLASPTG